MDGREAAISPRPTENQPKNPEGINWGGGVSNTANTCDPITLAIGFPINGAQVPMEHKLKAEIFRNFGAPIFYVGALVSLTGMYMVRTLPGVQFGTQVNP